MPYYSSGNKYRYYTTGTVSQQVYRRTNKYDVYKKYKCDIFDFRC